MSQARSDGCRFPSCQEAATRRGQPKPPFRLCHTKFVYLTLFWRVRSPAFRCTLVSPHRPLTRHCHLKDADEYQHRVSYRASRDIRVTFRSRNTPCATDVDLDGDKTCKVRNAVSRHESLIYGTSLHRRTEPNSSTFVCILLQKKESLFVSEISLANTPG